MVQIAVTPVLSNIDYNRKKGLPKRGSCISRNVIYFAASLLCIKGYDGKTVSYVRAKLTATEHYISLS